MPRKSSSKVYLDTQPRCADEVALERAAHQQGDLTSDSQYRCYCCGRKAGPFRILTLSDKGWVCSTTSVLLEQAQRTSAERKRA